MSSISSDPNLHTATFNWTIDNFPSLEIRGDDLYSSDFSAATADKLLWRLLIKPNGKNPTHDTISLYLQINSRSDNPQTIFATFSAHILSNKGVKTVSKSTRIHQYTERSRYGSSSGTILGWKDFWTKDENFRTNLLSNNSLTICVEVEFSTVKSALVNSCDKTSLRSDAHVGELIENLASLMETQAFSDVVLSTKSKDFPAHKVILASRSKVFAAMFKHDTKENQLNRIEIEDMSEDTVAEMIRFIYTGTCEQLNEVAEELLAASEKYDLNRLKIISGKALFQKLSAENASRVLILADTFNSKELKNDVLEFIVSKGLEVFSTAGWKDVLSKPELVDEVCQALARQLTFERLEANN